MPTNDNLQRCSFWKHAPLNTLVTLAPAANHVKWDFWTVSPIDGPSVVTNTITVTIQESCGPGNTVITPTKQAGTDNDLVGVGSILYLPYHPYLYTR